MFRSRLYAARIYNARVFGGNEGGGPRQSKGRRLVRWLIDIPMVPNPLGEYVWRREEEDEIFVLFGQ